MPTCPPGRCPGAPGGQAGRAGHGNCEIHTKNDFIAAVRPEALLKCIKFALRFDCPLQRKSALKPFSGRTLPLPGPDDKASTEKSVFLQHKHEWELAVPHLTRAAYRQNADHSCDTRGVQAGASSSKLALAGPQIRSYPTVPWHGAPSSPLLRKGPVWLGCSCETS